MKHMAIILSTAISLVALYVSAEAETDFSDPTVKRVDDISGRDGQKEEKLIASAVVAYESKIDERLTDLQELQSRLSRAVVDSSIAGERLVERSGRLYVASESIKTRLLRNLSNTVKGFQDWKVSVKEGRVFLPEFGKKEINYARGSFYGQCEPGSGAGGPVHFVTVTRIKDGDVLGVLSPGEEFVRIEGYDLSGVGLEDAVVLVGMHRYAPDDYRYETFAGEEQLIPTIQKIDGDAFAKQVLEQRLLASRRKLADKSPISDTPQTTVQFMGSGGNARTIVFVLEADGSIISDYPQIVNNLARTLHEMTEKQSFSVVVFDGEGVKEVPPAGLRMASPAAKAATIKWLRNTANVKSSGAGDVIPALKLAARLQPELVFLLSQNLHNPGRRDYEKERSEILAAVKALPSNMAINTVEFNQVDPLAGNGRASLMEEIARLSNGGKWNFVQTNVQPSR